MKKILFVDDEPAVLGGLEVSLRKFSRRWDMTFACGGDAAISKMADSNYDVVVSDVGMPGLSGMDVLRHAKKKHPNAVRIALTGYADDKNTIMLTEVAQRCLIKPCAVDEIDAVISRDTGLIEAFDNPIVQELAGAAGRLPAGANVQGKLLESINSKDSSVYDIASLVEEDLALTAKILQLANSSFFRRQVPVVSARQAITHLGLEVIRSLLLADQIFEKSKDIPKMDYFDVPAIQQHSQLCSSIAKEITPESECSSAAMTAGLLHDVGKLIIAIERPEVVAALVGVRDGAPNTWVSSAAERDILGCTHSEIGGYFLNLWGVPTSVVEAVTFHDTPSAIFSHELDIVGVVHISNYLAHLAVEKEANDVVESKLDHDFLEDIAMSDKLDEWKFVARDVAAALSY